MGFRDWLKRVTGEAKIQSTSDTRREEWVARARAAHALFCAAEETAWWRDFAGLVDVTDKQLLVIGPGEDATPDDLQGLGRELERWTTEFPQARHIWGLADLLEGRCPRTPPIYFTIPYTLDGFGEGYQPVALVHVANGTDLEAAAKGLCERLSRFDKNLVWFSDPDSYDRWNR